jgi:O-antigen/teichoic acid export membrane protein
MNSINLNRNKIIRINTLFVFLLKGVNLFCLYVMVPLQIDYLDTYNYGIWITIFSMLNWFQFLDIGLGNGLRNMYAKCVAKNDRNLAKYYVSTTYFLVGIISFALLIIFLVIGRIINWPVVFNVNKGYTQTLYLVIMFVFGSVIISFPLKLIISIFNGAQKTALANLFTPLANLISLLIVYFFMVKNNKSNLLYIGINYSLVPVFLYLAATIYFFFTSLKAIRPSLKFVKKIYVKDLTGLGIKFFILQLNAIILYSTDSFIIAHLLGQNKVSQYNVMYKLYSLPFIFFQIISLPYWSAFTHAYEQGDIKWIKKILKNLMLLWIGIVIALLGIFFFNGVIFQYWIKSKIPVNPTAGIFFVIYFALYGAMIPFVNFINGTGKIKLQLYIACLVSIVNIPLTIYFTKNLKMDISGSIAAGIICTLPFVVLMAIQTVKIINNSLKPIWNA